MTAALALEQRHSTVLSSYNSCGSKMAAVSAKVGAARRGQARQEDVLPAQKVCYRYPIRWSNCCRPGCPGGSWGC